MAKSNNKILVIIALVIVYCCPGCVVNDPVSDDYFLDASRILGGEKPEPAPCINSINVAPDCTYSTYYSCKLIIDFSCTTTIDPDTGTNSNLVYYFYASLTDPDGFADETYWYHPILYIGGIEQLYFDITGEPLVVEISREWTATPLYLWISASDGGRESDHSPRVEVNLTVSK